ncbi:septum formation protein [Pustulibacterium marinum]|uniref:dTTP/UTP pyrophosphatase n=1 Tax=Pustulibacterium marinum TaxID=1224947 RepID=A0A1I7H719_9FLAO|nr:Maf family nucleotide pyrophosphatase [Pustulibacterium marinum]SFU56493.1 septum formation protein [Pustulibacterium marinum]
MLAEILKNYTVVLASNSPRRHQFLKDLGINFVVRTKEVEEIYPENLQKEEITSYLAKLKAASQQNDLKAEEILITSDTIVWLKNKALGKPKDSKEAFEMISSLSGKTHEVISSVCVTSTEKQFIANTITEVTFRELTAEEIDFYITNYKPFDKAGAYGIQEWIGYVGITSITGSYNSVVGLPTHELYRLLKEITQ